MANIALARETLCLHCATPVSFGKSFCCFGCESVYNFIQKERLGHFYELRDSLSFRAPLNTRDKKKISSIYLPLEQDKASTLRLYIEGIHCLGCLWILEKLPDFLDDIKNAALDIDSNILTITRKSDKTSWQEVIKTVQKLGYYPQIIDNDIDTLKAIDTKRQLTRIGVAAFGAGNIMLLSISIYSGIDQFWGIRFGWLSLLFALPVLTYSAWPMYKNTFHTWLKKFISIDTAIVLALFSGTVISIWSLVSGTEKYIYFDSLTMLVFLLLLSRFFLQKMREKIGKESPLLNLLTNETYRVKRENQTYISLSANALKKNDELTLNLEQIVPTDSKLKDNNAYFDLSMLTGESAPIQLQAGEIVESGSKCLSKQTTLEVLSEAKDSRFAKILDQIKIKKMSRTPTVEFADRIAKFFSFSVLFIAALLVLLNPTDEGFRRALAIIIVSCPCVLALSIPLAVTKALQIAAKNGILFIQSEKLESLSKAQKIFFDKTGTLTNGNFGILTWQQIEGSIDETKIAIKLLEQKSSHPIARSLVRSLSEIKTVGTAFDVKEIPGVGIEGYINDKHWRIQKSKHTKPGTYTLLLAVLKNGRTVAKLQIGDRIRKESVEIVSRLKKLGYGIEILSGDSYANVKYVAEKLDIAHWYAEILPEDKSAIVTKYPNSIMIGDGINDAIAFQSASVGISMQGSIEASAKNSDIIFTQPGLKNLLTTLLLAKRTQKTIVTNFYISLFYNIIGGSLAILGFLNPLWAAVLMPMSALSVFLWTHTQMERRLE